MKYLVCDMILLDETTSKTARRPSWDTKISHWNTYTTLHSSLWQVHKNVSSLLSRHVSKNVKYSAMIKDPLHSKICFSYVYINSNVSSWLRWLVCFQSLSPEKCLHTPLLTGEMSVHFTKIWVLNTLQQARFGTLQNGKPITGKVT